MTELAPSENGQQSYSFSGLATTADCKTSSTVIFLRRCAFGFNIPFSWFLTATWAKSSSVASNSFRYALAIDANSPGNEAPDLPS